MPNRVNLRRNNPSALTSAQADQSLDQLSLIENVTADQPLYTGGEYVTNGVLTLQLPADGNKFAITVRSGQVTLTGGTVEGVSNAVLPVSGRRMYSRESGDWKIVAVPPSDYTYVDASRVLSITDRYLWVDTSASEITMTIPAGLPSDKTFELTRKGANNLNIVPSGVEGILVDGTPNLDGITLNVNGDVRIYKVAPHWEYAGKQAD